MKKLIIIQLLTPLFLVACQAVSQHGQKDVTADSIPVKTVEACEILSEADKEDSIRFASYLQLFKDTASVEEERGSKLFGYIISPAEFYQKMAQYPDLYPVSDDSSCVYHPGVCVQEYPYAYVTLLRMGDAYEEWTDHYTETLLVTYHLKERRMIDFKILGRYEKENYEYYAVKSVLSPLQLITRQFLFDADSVFFNTGRGTCEVTETEYTLDSEGYIVTKQRQWRDEGEIRGNQDIIDYHVYLKSERPHTR